MVERKGAEIPIYFISRTLKGPEERYSPIEKLKGPEERYSPIEKLVLSLVYTARKLRQYFQAHEVQVLTDKPLQRILTKPEISGRLAKWAIELGEYSIEYKPRTAFKGQVIADFLTEAPASEIEEVLPQGRPGGSEKVPSPEDIREEHLKNQNEPVWNLHTDGTSNEDKSVAGLILVSPEGTEFTYTIRLSFASTNNEAEYEALLAGLRVAHKMSAKRIQAHVDSLLVANQVNGDYESKDPKMIEYLKKTKELLQGFQEAKVVHIPRGQNKKADALSKLASVAFDHLEKEVRVETMGQPSILEKTVGNVETYGYSWMAPIVRYLQE
ncbi:uncharacterized protein LOC143539434 [Bidens hawaiensis]|uniref:uncharacterized protein LOC143539434 n=1 Tax=Bidens hawaiensis TaxID=980011 RepID=UPI00404AA338